MIDCWGYKSLKIKEKNCALALDNFFSQISDKKNIIRVILFGDPENNEQYSHELDVLKNKINEYFGDKPPLFNYIAQKNLLDSDYSLEIHSLDNFKNIEYKKYKDIPYILIDFDDCKEIHISGIKGDNINDHIFEQSQQAFLKIGEILKKEDYPIESIIRQWNYIEKITYVNNGRQNYQEFNDAR